MALPGGDEDAPSMTPHQEWKPPASFTLHSHPQLEGDTERAPLSHVSGLAGEVPTFQLMCFRLKIILE